MNSRHWLLSLLLLATVAQAGAPNKTPYKITLHESARAKQHVVYARVDDHGFGVQYWRNDSATAVGSFAGLVGLGIGSMVDAVKSQIPTSRAKDDAARIASLMDRAAAQAALEDALGKALVALPQFADPVPVKELGADARLDAGSFAEDPVLVVELYATLTGDYRGLQVTAITQSLSRSQADPLYRNRFDYVSDLLPAPHVKTKDEIKSDVEAIQARYRGRKLTKEEDAQQKHELREARAGTTWKIWYDTLLDQWLADNGSPLREALQQGIAGVAPLIAKDLPDVAAAEVRSTQQMRRRLPQSTASDRYTSVMVGGPFAGAIMSEPEGLNATYCQGVAFNDSPTKQQSPKLCP
ncbi:MAG TPA: hypothetical protein VH814_11870 [Steroidobacteraceae bacterium]|jgi:hypothetical protein